MKTVFLSAALSVAVLGSTVYAQQTTTPLLATNQTFGYGNGQVLTFTYGQSFDCVDQPGWDLNFDGAKAASDPGYDLRAVLYRPARETQPILPGTAGFTDSVAPRRGQPRHPRTDPYVQNCPRQRSRRARPCPGIRLPNIFRRLEALLNRW